MGGWGTGKITGKSEGTKEGGGGEEKSTRGGQVVVPVKVVRESR